eukprot:TRINITY_DN32459_c0_g1_i1.p1 TRINITY_DN32459_c0_g1~~TRINITY_DN32459_c0_g1_i1.p1  ORF type:complete len:758 (-),score=103.74 TRINITY_DN32459_c0_g1_i1:48-2321(-)
MTDAIAVSVLTAHGKTLEVQVTPQDTTLRVLAEQVASHVGAGNSAHLSFVLPRRVVTAQKHGDVLCSELMSNGDKIVVSSLAPKLASYLALSDKNHVPPGAPGTQPQGPTDTAWPVRIQRAKQRTAQLQATHSIPPDAVLAVKKAGLDPMEYNAGAVAIFVRVAEMAGSGYAHQRIWAACQEAGFECQRALHILFGQQIDNHDGDGDGGRDLRQSMSMDSVSSLSATSYTGDLLNGTSPVMTLLDRTPTSSTAPESARDFDGLTAQQPSPSPLSPPRPRTPVTSQPSTPSSTTGMPVDVTRHTLLATPASSTTEASDAPFTPPSASDHDPARQGIRYLDSPLTRFRGPSFARENGNVHNVTALRPGSEDSPEGTPPLPATTIPPAPVPTLVLPDHVVQQRQQQAPQRHVSSSSSSQRTQASSSSTSSSSHSSQAHARATVRHVPVHAPHQPLAVAHEEDAGYLAQLPAPRHRAGHQHHAPLGVDNDDVIADRIQHAGVVHAPSHRVHVPLAADTTDARGGGTDIDHASGHQTGSEDNSTGTGTTTSTATRHTPGHVHHRAMDSTILAPQVARITQQGAPVVSERPHQQQSQETSADIATRAQVSESSLLTTGRSDSAATTVASTSTASGNTPPPSHPHPASGATCGPGEGHDDPRDRVIGRWVDMPGHGAVNTRILASVVRDQRVRDLLQRPEMVHGLSLYLDQLLHLDELGALGSDGAPATGATAVLLDEVAHRLGIQDALRHLDGIVQSETRPDE